LKACEEVADKLKRTEVERDGLRMQLSLKDEQLAIRAEQAKNYEEQIKFWKETAEAAKQIFANNDRLDRNSQQALVLMTNLHEEDKQRIRDLEEEVRSLRSSRDKWRLATFGAGGAAIYFRKN
jgi:hypothetical protein